MATKKGVLSVAAVALAAISTPKGIRYSELGSSTVHVHILPDRACRSEDHTSLFLPEEKSKICDHTGNLKVGRGHLGTTPYIKANDLATSLHTAKDFTEDFDQLLAHDFVFQGSTTTWPAFGTIPMRLRALTCGVASEISCALTGCSGEPNRRGTHIWKAEEDHTRCPSPAELIADFSRGETNFCGHECTSPVSFRATFDLPVWDDQGWEKNNKGHAFSYSELSGSLHYGMSLLDDHSGHAVTAKQVSLVTHQYVPAKMTEYHTLVFVEWSGDHVEYGTIFELAYVNGVAGRKGYTSWLSQPVYKAFPPEMIRPYIADTSEVRIWDLRKKTASELLEYMTEYSPSGVHDDARYTNSAIVRQAASSKTKHDAFKHALEYIQQYSKYGGYVQNCQNFAFDMFRFMAEDSKDLDVLLAMLRNTNFAVLGDIPNMIRSAASGSGTRSS